MKNTYVSIILVALLFVSCGRAAKKTTVKEPVSEEALLEQVAEEENLSEFERTQFVPTLESPICSDTNAVYCATFLFAWDEVRKIVGTPLSISDSYRDLNLLRQRHPTWRLCAISSDPAFERSYGKKAAKKRRLYNGRLECVFYIYD